MTGAEVVALNAGKELFKPLINDIYNSITTCTKRKLKQWNTENKIEQLYRQIAKVRKVKTIWQVDKTVDLMAFYCDSHVVINDERRKVLQLSDFETKDNLVIQGIAGQGKSIFLRYLCYVELARGNCIPIFIELRRISKSYSLRDRIYMAFKSLKLDVDDELFEALAASGKIVLLLDAFDEIPDDLKNEVLTDIEDLASTNDGLRIIVSSRPDNNIQMSNQFSLVNLDNLRDNEYSIVIRKLAAGEAWADVIIKHIQKQATHIRDLLCTPLMVTLLILSYKSYQKLPNRMADFYDALFQTLLQRHDGTKPGFKRERTCSLDDSQYRKVFETLCILAKKTREQSYSYATIHGLAKNALEQYSLDDNPECFVNDIVKITCLILRDGEEHRFIHKTVQEYYTASFVAKQPEAWALSFYEKIVSQNAFREWHQELDFLSEIDLHRYNRYFYLPSLLNFLEISEDEFDKSPPRLTQRKLRSIIEPLCIELSEKGYNGAIISGPMLYFTMDFIRFVFETLDKMGAMEKIANTKLKLRPTKMKFNSDFPFPTDRFVKLSRVLDAIQVTSELTEKVNPEYQKYFTEARNIRDSLVAAENPDLLDGLI